MNIDKNKISPMMRQYLDTKDEYPDCLLFYRIGDFYELFFDDARIASNELDLVLTGKDCGLEERAPMCGVPYHAADTYIERLVKKGYKVAIGEQVEDPRLAKGLVKRSVIRVITPGTLMEKDTESDPRNNFLMSLIIDPEKGAGAAYVDAGTGEFFVSEISGSEELIDQIGRFMPSEIILPAALSDDDEISAFAVDNHITLSILSPVFFSFDKARELIEKHFHRSLDELSLNELTVGISAAGAALSYIYKTQFSEVSYISTIETIKSFDHMIIDRTAVRNLELFESLRDRERYGTLLWVLDKTRTAMGGRCMRRMILEPLIDRDSIILRQDAVGELCGRFIDREEIREYLKPVYDLERLLSRISSMRANPPELIALRDSLSMIPAVKETLKLFTSSLLGSLYAELDTLTDIYELIKGAILDEPKVSSRDGGIINDGFDEEVDRLRGLRKESHRLLMELEAREREKTGIRTLRVKYNKNFGHCIEVSNSFLSLVPPHYIRKQTLTGAERYTTDELIKLSDDIMSAEDKAAVREEEIFRELLRSIDREAARIRLTAQALAYIDALCSLSLAASRNKYVRPSINNKGVIDIRDGRHPVVELMLRDSPFIANDVRLNGSSDRIAVITGPNMAGKSTYLRQTALIVIMAQMGSFVPAKSADISISDRVFTRVGASDDLAGGRSTFMVEMSEVADILKKATSNSLVIMDEIGRGTGTQDGLAIAWAIIDYIAGSRVHGAKTLFATHYQELTELEGRVKGVKNYRILVRERDGELIFLRKILKGGADRSYGIEVARLAGVPEEVVKRAKEISDFLSGADALSIDTKALDEAAGAHREPVDDKAALYASVSSEIIDTNIDSLTPLEAIFFLSKLKERLRS